MDGSHDLNKPRQHVEALLVTPEMAQEYMTHNVDNRPLRKSWVKALCGIIERGEFKLTPDAIAFSWDGDLLTGQHRLTAIIQTGQAVWMNVAFNCDPKIRKVIDSGVKRTIGDHLHLPRTTVAMAKMLHYLLSNAHHSVALSSAQIEEVLGWAGPVIEEVRLASLQGTRFTNTPIQLAAAISIMGGTPGVLEQVTHLNRLELREITPSLESFTRQLMGRRASSHQGRWDMAARAWRAFQSPDVGRIQIKDLVVVLGEMKKMADNYRRMTLRDQARSRSRDQ